MLGQDPGGESPCGGRPEAPARPGCQSAISREYARGLSSEQAYTPSGTFHADRHVRRQPTHSSHPHRRPQWATIMEAEKRPPRISVGTPTLEFSDEEHSTRGPTTVRAVAPRPGSPHRRRGHCEGLHHPHFHAVRPDADGPRRTSQIERPRLVSSSNWDVPGGLCRTPPPSMGEYTTPPRDVKWFPENFFKFLPRSTMSLSTPCGNPRG